MHEHDLGPMPEPTIEPGEPGPGGVDAVPVRTEVLPVLPDLPAGLGSVRTAAPPEPERRRHAGRKTRTRARSR